MMPQRLDYLDAAKALAILCVLIGHVIQWTSVADPYSGSVPFQFIYSFHMPLFFTVSGFFLHKSLAMPLGAFLLRRARQLLLPLFSFVTVFWLFHTQVGERFLGFDALSASYLDMLCSTELWFLKYLFACLVIAWVSIKVFRRPWLAALLPTLLLVFCFRVGVFRELPFLWLGYMLHRYDGWVSANLTRVLPLSGAAFAVLLCMWCGDFDKVYGVFSTHGGVFSFSAMNLFITIEHMFVGMAGSVFILALLRLLFIQHRPERLTTYILGIGRNTLGIYCLQRYLLEHGVAHILFKSDAFLMPLFNLVASLALLVVFNSLVAWLRRWRVASMLFLGS